jgi:hypothetical protein
MPARSKEERLRQLGSSYEVLTEAIELDRKSRNTLKIQREALGKQARDATPPECRK